MLTERLNKRIAEKAELEAQLAVEENKKITLTEAQILAFLDYVCEMPADDVNKRRAIINIFVHSIYLYDDHFTLIINASKKPLSIDNIPLDDIEEAFEGKNTETEGCSSLMTPAPPKGYYTNLFTLSAAFPSQYGSSNTDRKERIFSLVESVRSFFMSCGLSTDCPWTVCGQSADSHRMQLFSLTVQ